MYLIEEILEKLNATGKTKNSSLKTGTPKQITLPDIMVRSFAEVKELAGDALSWGEKNFLYQQAQKELNENKMAESRILSRANPQLANAVRLGIRQSSMLGSYDNLFPERTSRFVKPGSVASMFSPAGYLTELYREARGLHADTSQYHLDTRRPDLASLPLSQSNMDDELSTLYLSNELLLNNIQSQESLDYDGALEMLSTYRQTGATPYSQPYEAVRQAIILQDPDFTAFRNNPAVAAKMDTASLLGIQADISPELHKILTEEITEAKADELIKENFGDIALSALQSITYLARWYGVSYDEMSLLLSLVSTADNTTPGVQYYQNDQLISLVESDGKLCAVSIKRTLTYDSNDSVNYVELIPQENGKYILNFKLHNTYECTPVFRVGTEGSYSYNVYKDDSFVPEGEKAYSIAITLDEDKLSAGLTLSIGRWSLPGEGGGRFSDIYFKADTYPFSVFLLKLNKVIRLYKASGIAPSDIRTVIESSNNDLTITENVLSQLFWVHYYMQTYGIDVSAALVLTGAVISQINHSNTLSAFTRLFNSPPLNNQLFYADGTALSLKPGASDDTFRLGVLKRALQVNDTELYTLWGLTGTKFTATIDKLSALYRTRLLAEIHGLSVTEMGMLLSVSPYAGKKLGSLKDTALSGLVSFIAQYTQWLKDQNWTVRDLYLMLTDRFSTTLTPDIENLITTLKNGLASQDLSQASEAELITAAVPFIAAATQLDSAEKAKAVLQWLSQLKPQDLTISGFLTLADSEARTDDETASLVSFCQVLGQMALTVRSLGLSVGEIALAVTQSGKILPDSDTLPRNIATIRTLARFHHWVQQCGTSATEILSALDSGTLTPAQLAQAMMLDKQMVVQGLAQAEKDYEKTGRFGSWTEIDITLQWVDMAATLGITPAEVRTLVNVKFAGGVDPTTWNDWVAISNTLQGGLSSWQAMQLQAVREEALSTAISAYAIKNISPGWVTDRDRLYSWLLIDNQVSAQIKTTRIAEAIASVQLYVNRALSGQEEGAVTAVKSKPFFTSDWEMYNKRYSTWAGVSQLVYYPENYVDPTMRTGQTGMMDEMLQKVSQSQLNSDAVEVAFKTYMTRFEDIANLDVISGYHDSISDQDGTTYLVGKSAAGKHYWRSADINKMSDGKLPANAWSEWKEITAGISPVENLIRPVIFQSRLYLVWVEVREVATTTGSTTMKSFEYLMKYAHILHDGTWSAPVVSSLSDKIIRPYGTDIKDIAMFCSRVVAQEELYIFFHKIEPDYKNYPIRISGITLSSDGEVSTISSDGMDSLAYSVNPQLTTTSSVKVNTKFNNAFNFPKACQCDYTPGNVCTSTYGSTVRCSDIKFSDDKQNVVLKFNATARVVFSNTANERSGKIIELMKYSGHIGDIFHLPSKKETYGKTNAELIFNYTKPFTVYAWRSPGESKKGGYIGQDISEGEDSYRSEEFEYEITKEGYLKYALPPHLDPAMIGFIENEPYDYVMFYDFYPFNTSIDNKDVMLSAWVGNIQNFESISRDKYSFDESLFSFGVNELAIPVTAFINNSFDLLFKFSTKASVVDKEFMGDEILCLTLNLPTLPTEKPPVILLNKTTDNAQYLQYGVYRIRVNTLFARQLVSRANTGLDTVLSMETQNMAEPKLGAGSYIEVIIPAYNASEHGHDRGARLQLANNHKGGEDNVRHIYWSGLLKDNPFTVKIFIATAQNPGEMHFPYNRNSGLDLFLSCAKGTFFQGNFGNISDDLSLSSFSASNEHSSTRDVVVRVLSDTTEPMDFSGANALYFWEMFYYVPMMVFKRLLNENRFSEATQWIKYIWNPEGYLVHNQPATYQWNVRPLEEETTWHANPLDSVDPDAVSQADPLHYKIATFMGYLDLLIARGDTAYRQLERDTLNEARMWYVQALDVLGDEPYLTHNTAWTTPKLTDAAEETTNVSIQQSLLAVRQQTATGELGTANSLTRLFLPQQNEKLAGYWQTLAQRLYNLRNNLSIDGNPLSMAIYAAPVSPAALLSAAVNVASGGASLPDAEMPMYRFPLMLESARGLVNQLIQFGSTLLSITERQDAEALSELLQTQGSELVLQSIAQQLKTIEEIDADRSALKESRTGAQSRLDSYSALYDEDVNTREKHAMKLALAASVLSTTAILSHTVAAGLDTVPNVYGMACGGSRYGSIARAIGTGIEIGASASRAASDTISQSEMYRRRREDWDIQRNSAQSEVKQIDAQLASLTVRREAAVLQKTYLETQLSHTQAQMTFLQNKFSNKALYNWLRGKLSAIYYQFYDLTVSRCLMAQKAYQWALATPSATFIRPGAWQGTYAGLNAGETLMLNLTQMEQEYLKKEEREKEVTSTVCLSQFYAGLPTDAFVLADQVVSLVTKGSGEVGTGENTLYMKDKQLQARLKLADLKMVTDYPDSLGKKRRIKQISVTLPALTGPYQDVRAVLSYGGSVTMPRGCDAIAVSHGMNDSGQFQLDFNDSRWLPFEGIPVDDGGSLTLRFPDADSKQKDLLLSLTDIILHIRYTITG